MNRPRYEAWFIIEMTKCLLTYSKRTNRNPSRGHAQAELTAKDSEMGADVIERTPQGRRSHHVYSDRLHN
jgi:hypothetical protein